MSTKCDDIIRFKQGETALFKLYLKTELNGVTKPWKFPAADTDITSLTLTVNGESGSPVVFDFNNTTTAPTNEAITITDRENAELTIALNPTQTASVKDAEEGCPESMEIKVDQLNPEQEVKCFQFVELLEVGKSLFD